MRVKGIIFEDLINYKKPCMTIEFPLCSFKCDKECGMPVCQNSTLVASKDIDVDIDDLIQRYINNPITSAICCQGLEPFDSWNDLLNLITTIREHTNDDIVIYTGYNKDEIFHLINQIKKYENIIIKYGRFIPDQNFHYDEILGVQLASNNQYAEKIS